MCRRFHVVEGIVVAAGAGRFGGGAAWGVEGDHNEGLCSTFLATVCCRPKQKEWHIGTTLCRISSHKGVNFDAGNVMEGPQEEEPIMIVVVGYWYHYRGWHERLSGNRFSDVARQDLLSALLHVSL